MNLRAKILAICVVGGMTVAMVVTAVGAVSQALNEDAVDAGRGQLVSQAGEDRQAGEENALVSGFKFVCPFH